MRKTFILPLIISMFGVLMIVPARAQATTIGVEPQSTVNRALGIDSTFKVEIWVRNVVDLAGFDFKLAYETNILTVTKIEYGGIFGVKYFPLISKIYDAAGYLHYSAMEWFGDPGFSGDGRAAIISFKVDFEGVSFLDLYATRLGNSAAKPIDHAAIDGCFSNIWTVMPEPSELYVGLTAGFVESRHFKVSKEPDTLQTLTAQIEHMGTVSTAFRATFRVLDSMGGPVAKLSASGQITPGQVLRVSADLDTTKLAHPASYIVEMQVEYTTLTGPTLGRRGDIDAAKTTFVLSFKLEY